MGWNFIFKYLTSCFKPSDESHNNNNNNDKEIEDDVIVKDKLSDPIPKLKVSDTGKKFNHGGKIETNFSTTVKYTWNLWNFSQLTSDCKDSTNFFVYFDTFFTGDYPWRITLYPQGFRTNYLSIYLTAGDNSLLSAGSWGKTVNYKLTLKNHYFPDKEITFVSTIIKYSEFHDPNKGFLVNDNCVIMAEVCVKNDGRHEHPNDNRIMPLVKRNTNNNDNLVDFKGLCKVKKDFVPLWEEACSKHPKLVEEVKKRNQSEKFIEESLMTLGRVLHFLTSQEDGKDMNDDVVKELQNLWEKLECFGFDDPIWLECDHMIYVVKKLEENVDFGGEEGELLKELKTLLLEKIN